MPASQDYRDGAAYGAIELAKRINEANRWGVKLADWQIQTMAEEIGFAEMGGMYDGTERRSSQVGS